MTISELLGIKLGTRLAKFLLKTYLKEPGAAIGSDLIDIAGKKIESYFDRKAVVRQFEAIGESLVAHLQPFFEVEALPHEVNSEAVVDQLSQTLNGNISAEFFLARELDSSKLLAALRNSHPLPSGQFSVAEIDLYERSLSETVRYLVEIADSLPRFDAAYAEESLRRLFLIGTSVEEIAKAVMRIETIVERQGGDYLSQQYETDYRLAVARKLNFLELFGADLPPESRRRSLSVAYISIDLKSVRNSENSTDPIPSESVLHNLKPGASRLLIRGEAGGGKTTLFRWAAVEAAANTQWDEVRGLMSKVSPITKPQDTDPLPNSWRRKIPFFIRLRECQGGRLPRLEDFPESIARELGRPPVAWVRSILSSGRAILLLDGIDEIPQLDRERVKKDLEDIVSTYPDNYYLVSTRPEAVPGNWLETLGFCEVSVLPMSESAVSKFIDKWHDSVAFELLRLGRKGEDMRHLSVALKQSLRDNLVVARLAVNPLLCAIICALHRDRNKILPKGLADLCEDICKLLLVRRDQERGAEFPSPYSSLNYQQKRAIVRELAYAMVVNWESSVTYARAKEKIAEALRLFPGVSTINAADVLSGLIERSGMLREVKPGHLDFIHNTFKEYLAGDRMADSGDAGLLAQQALDSTWQRVVLLAMTTSRMDFASAVISRLLDFSHFPVNSPGVKDSRRMRVLLAMRCMGVALFVTPELKQHILEEVREIQPPRNFSEAEAFASLSNEGLECLRRRDGLESSDAAACVRALRLIATPEARHALEAYLQDRRSEVISELAQAFNPLAIRFYREEVVLKGEKLSPSVARQIFDLTELDRLFVDKFNHIQTIHLDNTAVEDLTPLQRFKDLVTLTLDNSFVRDLSPVAGLTKLKKLSISGTRITDISILSRLQSLKWLDFSGTQISNITALRDLRDLEYVNFADTRVRDISPLAKLGNLRYVDLRSTDIKSLQPLAGRHNIKVVGPS
ncbi:MAG TPA: NACHT domain-containing protein [Thermoanaerobaculia bacterium]